MYVITNREVRRTKPGLEQFGATLNAKGANELRVAEVERDGDQWDVRFIADRRLPKTEVRALARRFRLSIDLSESYYPSFRVACEVAHRARTGKRHVLLFVHGYNNDMADVLNRARDLQERYAVEVLPFSWPANGGGLAGTLSYKSDKRDARASAGALERALERVHRYFRLITESYRQRLFERARHEHPDNAEARDQRYAGLLDAECPFSVNVMFHSMGNYLLKHMLKSSINEGNNLTFENIVLCQADTNNLDHALWVDTLRFRKRLFITINENDRALDASRIKTGSEQLARLGHYVRDLTSRNAHYINLTGAPHVGNSHAPFGEPAARNERVAEFFRLAFSGQAAEEDLRFHPEGNWYAPR